MVTEANINEIIEENIKNSPLSLLCLQGDEKLINLVNSYLPFSIGFEIECTQKNNFTLNEFKQIPGILDVNIDPGEQRFRIPEGINGLLCLYCISVCLKQNSELNPLSGIHYHVDFTFQWNKIKEYLLSLDAKDNWILSRLDSWNYAGEYNRRRIGTGGGVWLKTQEDFKTAEFRIGEMTFDYKVLIKRILHLSEIAKTIYQLCEIDLSDKTEKINNTLDKYSYLSYLKQLVSTQENKELIKEITENEKELSEIDKKIETLEKSLMEIGYKDASEVIKNRVIKISL